MKTTKWQEWVGRWGAICLLVGCASSTFVPHPPVAYGTQSDTTTGIRLRYAPRASYYHLVGHRVEVDEGRPIWLEPEGEVTLYLNPGRHEVRCASLSASSHPEEVLHLPDGRIASQFGYTSRLEVELQPHEIKTLTYEPPFFSERSGRIEEQ